MVTVIDIYTLYKEKRGKALELIDKIARIKHPHLVSIHRWWYIADQAIFIEMETPKNVIGQGSLQGVASSNIDTKAWKTFCKKKFSDQELFVVIKQIASGL